MLSKLSVKKPYTVIVGIILVIVLGVISFQHMSTDLLPSMNLPYVVVYTTYPGATPEQVESEVTRPMEAAFATLTDIKKLRSQSRDNMSVLIMEFNDGANMDTAMIEISSQLDQLEGNWDDDVGSPVALKLNPDMLPVAILSVTRDDMDIQALSDYVTDDLVPAFEGLNGVASANASGVIEQEIDITIEQSRIDVVNSVILEEIDKKLAKVERTLNEGQAQISAGWSALSSARSEAYAKLDAAEESLKKGESSLPMAIEALTAQRASLQETRNTLAETVAALESVNDMTDEEKAAVQQGAETLRSLRAQKAALEEQLAALQSGEGASELAAQRKAAKDERDSLAAQRDAQKTYIEDLNLLDTKTLNDEITRINTEIADAEKDLDAARAELSGLKSQQSELQKRVAALSAAIDDGGKGAADANHEAGADSGNSDKPSDSGKDDSNGGGSASSGGAAVVPVVGGQGDDDRESESGTVDAAGQDQQGQAPNGAEDGPIGGASGNPEGGDAPAEQTPTESTETTPEGNPEPAEGGAAESDTSASQEPADAPAQTQDATAGTQDATPDDAPATGNDDAQTASDGQARDTTAPEAAKDAPTEAAAGNQSEPETAKSEPKQDSAPEAASQPEAQPEANHDPAPEAAPEPAAQPEAKPEPEPEVKPEPAPEAQAQPEPEPAPEVKSEPEPEAKPEPAQEAAPAQEAQPALEAAPAPEPEAAPVEQSARLAMGRALAEGDDAAARQELAAAQSELEALKAQVDAKEWEIAALEAEIAEKRQEMATKQASLDTLVDTNEDVSARIDEANARIAALEAGIAALDQQIAALDSAIAGTGEAGSALAGQLAAVEASIQALEDARVEELDAMLSDPKQLKANYKEAKAGLDEVDAGLALIDSNLEKLNQGIIPAGFIDGIDEDTNLSESQDALDEARKKMDSAFSQAESTLYKAAKKLAEARAEFNEKREDAFKDAGLDGVITVQMVAQIIGAQNFSMPAGYVKDADGERVLVRVGDKYGSIDEIKRMKLFNLDMDDIQEVRMLDVASVRMADNRDDVFTKLDGSDGILLSLEKQSTYSTADVADTVLQKAKELQAANPDLHIVDLMNQGEYIDVVVDSVLNNLISGGGLAILVLLLFLLDWRPTLTVAFSIPISVVIAFVAMYFSGITLNVLSLSGLALGIGMLVDNSIVSIENIYRLHDEERLPLLRSCVEGVKSVSGALFSSTLTTICVFLPIVFVQGMARDLFADMGLTIAYSLLASLLVAMTVVPMMCSFLMRRSKPRKHRIFSKVQAAYAALLKGALRVKPLVLLAAVALLVFSGLQVTKMGVSFMPEVNSRQMSADLSPDKDMTDAEQKAQATQIMTDMLEIPGIQSIGLMDGSGTLLSSSGGGFSYYIIVDEDAGVKNVDIARQIEDIGKKYNADLTAQASTMDISMMTGSGISVEITGDDIEVLQQLAKDVADIARNTEGVTDVDDGLEDAVPELRIVVDKEKAVDESLTTAQVYQTIAQKLLEKTEVGKVTLDGKELTLQLIEGRNQGLLPEDIENIEIEVDKEDEDSLVRIGNISEVRDTTSLSTIFRASQRRMIEVSFGIADGYSANLVSDAFEAKLNEYKLPDGYRVELSGENETVMGIMEDLVWMILVAVLLIFLIMVAQFQSFKSPIIVMFTIPLAFTGGLLALLLTGMDLSIVAMLGFLVLSGVVVNNGIVFIDCVNQLRIDGWEKRMALVEAGRQRLRPILMTALTTILGMSTMALGHGTGAEMMQPMAVVSIGGLTYATLMTLFVVPVLYDLFNGKKMKAREIQMIREAAGMNGDEVLEGDGTPAARVEAPTAPLAPEAADAPEPAATEADDEPDRNAPPVPVFEPRRTAEPEPAEPEAPDAGEAPAAEAASDITEDAPAEKDPAVTQTPKPAAKPLRVVLDFNGKGGRR